MTQIFSATYKNSNFESNMTLAIRFTLPKYRSKVNIIQSMNQTINQSLHFHDA
jgi:hypothetical protein